MAANMTRTKANSRVWKWTDLFPEHRQPTAVSKAARLADARAMMNQALSVGRSLGYRSK